MQSHCVHISLWDMRFEIEGEYGKALSRVLMRRLVCGASIPYCCLCVSLVLSFSSLCCRQNCITDVTYMHGPLAAGPMRDGFLF